MKKTEKMQMEATNLQCQIAIELVIRSSGSTGLAKKDIIDILLDVILWTELVRLRKVKKQNIPSVKQRIKEIRQKPSKAFMDLYDWTDRMVWQAIKKRIITEKEAKEMILDIARWISNELTEE